MSTINSDSTMRLAVGRLNYLFIIPPLLVFAAGVYLHGTFGNPHLAVDTVGSSTDAATRMKANLLATGAAYRLVAMLFAFMVAAMATLAALASDLNQRISRQSAFEIVVLILVIFVPVFWYVILAQSSAHPPNHYYWGKGVFEEVSTLITPGRCYSTDGVRSEGVFPGLVDSGKSLCKDNAFLEHYVRITYVGNALSILGSLAAVMGMILTRAHPGTTPDGLAPAEATLKRYLYLGAIMLSIATAIYISVGNLGAAVVIPNMKDAYVDMTNGLTVYWGVVFSAILAAIYAPIALLTPRPMKEDEAENAPSAGPRRSIPEIAATLSAILSPVLTGLLGSQISFPA